MPDAGGAPDGGGAGVCCAFSFAAANHVSKSPCASAWTSNSIEPWNSPRPLLRRVNPKLLAESEVVYEAGEEYQLAGVFNFYLRRNILILEPPAFTPIPCASWALMSGIRPLIR